MAGIDRPSVIVRTMLSASESCLGICSGRDPPGRATLIPRCYTAPSIMGAFYPAAAAPPARALTLKICSTLDELQELRPAWDELLSSYHPASTFSTWEWLDSWWRSFGRDAELLVLALFNNSRLVGLAPLSISGRQLFGYISLRVLLFMGDGSEDSENLDFPVVAGFEEQFARTILDHLDQNRKHWDICELNTMPSDSSVAACLEKLLRSRAWTCFDRARTRSAVRLPATWDEYLHRLSSEDRYNLARYTRRLNKRYSTRIYRCTDQTLTRCLEALFKLHQARWQKAGEKGSFTSVARRQFYEQLSRRLLARGWLEMWVLELNDAITAVQFAFRYRHTVYQLQEGYDPEHASDRLGFVLRGAVLKQLVAEGVRVYDFLAGELSYKARWAAQSDHYRNLHFARPMSFGIMYLCSVVYSKRAKQWLRLKLPHSIWKVLHLINVQVRGRRDS
jgi:CelD/BcsL family acetyltransferase involved in cellulose biosynthesis